MSMKYIKLLTTTCLLLLCACALPGKSGLEQNGTKGSVKIGRNYQSLAKCLVQKFDHEEFGMMDVQTPVTSYRHYDDEKTIEMAHMAAVGNVYLWTMRLVYVTKEETRVEYIARNGVNPYLSSHYMQDKITANLTACTSKI